MRVLLIEDEVRLAETVRRGLVAEGMLVDVAHDGDQGLFAAQTQGYDVCRDLRASEIWTPVLILTAKDGEYDEVDAFDLGADDYLTKPFSFVVLVARLRSLVRRGAPERPTLLVAGDLSLDPATREVLRAGQAVSLTPREFGLLQYLLRHRGDVLSKTEILDNVWDLHYDGADNVVEVYVGYLRRKIDTPFGRSAIETIRGAGYRLAGDGG